MMDCTSVDVRDMLPDYVGDRLSAADRETVERHLAGCAECAAELSLVRSAARALAAAPAVDVARIVAALPAPSRRATPGVIPIESRRRPSAARRPSWASPGRAAALAAAVVGAVGLTLLGRDRTTPSHGTARVVAVQPPVESAPPSRSGAAPIATPAVTSVPSRVVPVATATSELSLAAGVTELSDESLRALLGDLDHLDESTLTEPAEPLPSVTDIDEESGV